MDFGLTVMGNTVSQEISKHVSKVLDRVIRQNKEIDPYLPAKVEAIRHDAALREAEIAYYDSQVDRKQEIGRLQKTQLTQPDSEIEKRLAQLKEQELADRRELSRYYVELLQHQLVQQIESQKQIQAMSKQSRWPWAISREELSQIFADETDHTHLLLLVAKPTVDVSKELPISFREGLQTELRYQIRQFTEEHYDPESRLRPVKLYDKYFEKSLFDAEIKQLEIMLKPVPTVMIYSDVTDHEVYLNVRLWGVDNPISLSFAPWDWEMEKAKLEQEGRSEKDSLRHLRAMIVTMHKIAVAFLSDWHYLHSNPYYEPYLLQEDATFGREVAGWRGKIAEPLRRLQTHYREAYEAEQKKLWFRRDDPNDAPAPTEDNEIQDTVGERGNPNDDPALTEDNEIPDTVEHDNPNDTLALTEDNEIPDTVEHENPNDALALTEDNEIPDNVAEHDNPNNAPDPAENNEMPADNNGERDAQEGEPTPILVVQTESSEKGEALDPKPKDHQLRPPMGKFTLPHIITGKPPLRIEWCWVLRGKFTMGSDKYSNQKPVHKVVYVEEFWMGRYPVTNAQYQLFIDAGGYNERKWWTDAGWKAKNAGWSWLDSQKTNDQKKWKEPFYWQNDKFNQPNHPVVGISWYEAVAFCEWASAKLGETIRLPTEAEWEKAARGSDGRIYPWGDDEPTNELCNFGNKQNGGTTPVGRYSTRGDSPFGCADMVGNVKEWTQRQNQSDSLENDKQNNKDEGLRGGSWSNYTDYCMATHRSYSLPSIRNNIIGFRVVCDSEPKTSR